ncbi:IS630 family transposase [Rhodoplanes serenus]|uniref:IS630 family transposase n=1 Tax=Rhodoplanes serenus TaxID=200615 RepID=UPI000DAD3FC1|nr:IS630 family transposase [Rhodoplanes serenus]RAI33063.1 IS630 family transposase [Rhodoplanes serenus]
MGGAVELRQDFGAEDLRRFAARARTGAQARRLLALAAVLDGMNRAEAARIGGMDRQTLRDWAHRFNQHGPDGLVDIKPVGRRPRLSDEHKQILKQLVEDGPDPETDGVVRWRCVDLKRVVRDRFGIDLSEVSLGRVLKQLGFSRISARPRHPMQDPEAIATFKKNFPAMVAEVVSTLAPGTPVEVWFQDEMRIGQKNSLVYQWAKTGSRPRQPKDQRYANAYVFGAVCPSRDTGVALIMPQADTEAMQAHLDAIGEAVAPGAHALLILDKAGWHTTGKLEPPANITLLPLPPACPELNPAENIWQYLRNNYLGNRVFADYTAILDACQDAWRKLLAETGRISSIAQRGWAIIGQS